MAHTLVHSDKADPASSSPSPCRFSCTVWLITVFLGLLLFSVKKKTHKQMYKKLVQQVVPWEVETTKPNFLCIYVLHHLILLPFSHQLAWVCGRACSVTGSVQWMGWDECADQPAHLLPLPSFYVHRGKIRTVFEICRIQDLNCSPKCMLAHRDVVWNARWITRVYKASSP